MKIPFFNYPAIFQHKKDNYTKIINDTLSKGAFIMQDELFEFEESLSEYLGVKHVIGMADGTITSSPLPTPDAISEPNIAIVPSHTFVASVAAIIHSGAKPILVDCSKDHLISSSSVEKSITAKTKAIMPVQLNGRVAKMNSILKIAEENNLLIIEDSCQALGAKFSGQFAGTFGMAGTFSFFPAKTLGCFGDGGAAITNDDGVAKRIKMFRDHGRDQNDGEVKLFGYNARLDNIQAAILNYKLKFYDEEIQKRRKIAAIYNDRLKNIESILLPPSPDNNEEHFDIYQNYEIEADNREELRKFLTEKGIGTILQWGGYAVHQFKELGFRNKLSYTDQMTKKFMLLPMHTLLNEKEVHYICNQINSFYS